MSDSSSSPTLGQLLALSEEDLDALDPVVLHLVVAKGLPRLADLDIGRYVDIVDAWAEDLWRRLPAMEQEFHKSPEDWRNDLSFFRLGVVCWFMENVLGIVYREDQREVKRILYTDPADLFIHGVIDT